MQASRQAPRAVTPRLRRPHRCKRKCCPTPVRGAFAGVSLEGATLKPDEGANENLYGKKVSAEEIIVKGVVPKPEEASVLLSTLNEDSPKNVSAGK